MMGTKTLQTCKTQKCLLGYLFYFSIVFNWMCNFGDFCFKFKFFFKKKTLILQLAIQWSDKWKF